MTKHGGAILVLRNIRGFKQKTQIQKAVSRNIYPAVVTLLILQNTALNPGYKAHLTAWTLLES